MTDGRTPERMQGWTEGGVEGGRERRTGDIGAQVDGRTDGMEGRMEGRILKFRNPTGFLYTNIFVLGFVSSDVRRRDTISGFIIVSVAMPLTDWSICPTI